MARVHVTTFVTVCLVALVLYILYFHTPQADEEEIDPPAAIKDIHIGGVPANSAYRDNPQGLPSKNVTKGSGQEGKVNVLLCSDGSTLGGMVAAMNSIYLNSRAKIKFYLVVDKDSLDHLSKWITQSSLKDLDYTIKVFDESWVKDKITFRDRRMELGSPLNYARLYFPRIFPDLKGRVIFVDSDTITQGDIVELNATKLEPGHAVAFSDDCSAVTSRYGIIINKYASFLNFQNEKLKGLGLNPMECSFNTGVFVVDVAEWKKQNVTARLDYWVTVNSKEDVYGNQRGGGHSGPPMLIVFYKKYTAIPPEWHIRHLGVTTGARYSEAFLKAAKLLHWNGRFKPWGHNSQHTLVWEKYYVHDPTGEFQIARRYGNV
ncbi:glycosyltransferase 8 domain-containing protein 1-like [Diadema antillarum]|uniref:glycosyltransferase 8 domain-containing protein 1-like n=1 Tax=Diadema antillarum TaxID=105358 RepID=UPI003A8856A9